MTAILLLHGWPGTRADWDLVRPALAGAAPVLAPDLLGFGDAYDGTPLAVADATADAHAARALALLDEHGHDHAVVAGYDIGSRVAQTLARRAPGRVAALVITPAFPALARFTGDPALQAEYWYQHFHRLPVSEQLIDGDADAVRAYLGHLRTAWTGVEPLAPAAFDAVVAAYARPGAFAASLAWYRANVGYAGPPEPIATPAIVLWGGRDPLAPSAWADAAHESFSAAEVRVLPDAGHFLPLEAPAAFAGAILEQLDRASGG